MKKNFLFFIGLFFVHFTFPLKNFVLISAPGSGKGTFSQYLVEKYGYVQICPGDLFRNEIALGTELGKQIQPIVDRGDYVGESVVCNLIEKYITEASIQGKPFILDGFPRSVASLEFLIELVKKKNLEHTICFLQFQTSDDECLSRILSRLVCVKCFKVYNTIFNKPLVADICDVCGTDLSLRKADKRKIVCDRLDFFHKKVEPLLTLVQGIYEVKRVNSECSFDTMKAMYETLVNE